MAKKVKPVEEEPKAEAPKADKAEGPKFFEGVEVVAVNETLINGKSYKVVTDMNGQTFPLSPEEFAEQVN